MLKRLIPLLVLFMAWWGVSRIAGTAVIPTPIATARAGWRLGADSETWQHVLITLSRGLTGLGIAACAALLLGVPCGISRETMRMVQPLVTACQGCPPVIWISLLMVWAGTGSTVPVAAIVVTVFPVMLANVAQGVASLDPRLFAMSRVYRIPRRRVFCEIVLPGIADYVVAALSFSLGITWKVTATAEFLGAGSGIGAQLYWAYRKLDMPVLFAWAVIVIVLGLALETWMIRPLRRWTEARHGPRHG